MGALVMQRILLIEDSADFQILTCRALSSPEMEVKVAGTLAYARNLLSESDQEQPFQLVLLDLNLPDGDGIEFLHELQSHQKWREIPVFLLTFQEMLSLKVTAFSLGAEDYISKSCSFVELKARVQMRLSKSKTKQKSAAIIKRGDLVIHGSLMKATLKIGGQDIDLDLTSKEFRILSFLAQNETKLFSRSQLIKYVWGASTHVLERTVDSHVCGLRKKLGTASGYIESVPGNGYRFVLPELSAKPPMSGSPL